VIVTAGATSESVRGTGAGVSATVGGAGGLGVRSPAADADGCELGSGVPGRGVAPPLRAAPPAVRHGSGRAP
jgi:hypothetical protein